MAKTKISKVARDLNLPLSKIVEFLRTKGIEVELNPNSRIEEEAENMKNDAFCMKYPITVNTLTRNMTFGLTHGMKSTTTCPPHFSTTMAKAAF